MRGSGRAVVWDAVSITAGLWVLVLAVWLNVRFFGGTVARISTELMRVHVDFDSFWRSAAALLAGGDIYDAGARLVNLNPPLWTVLISPLGLLEPLVAYRAFVVLSVIVTVSYLVWTAKELRLGAGWAVAGVGMLVFSSPLLATLALGQVYPLLALGLVVSWAADRRGRSVASGVALGLVVALKPTLAPALLWPLARRRWNAFGAALVSGAAATLVGFVLAGPEATFRYVEVLRDASVSPYWDNASLPGAAARLFTENAYVRHVAALPWTVPVAYGVGIGMIVLTAVRARGGGEAGLWALVAAALVAAPIAWHNYLVLLGPGVLLLLARGRAPVAFLLLALQFIPAQWVLLWNERGTVPATLALTLYLPILIAHWLALLAAAKDPAPKAGEETTA